MGRNLSDEEEEGPAEDSRDDSRERREETEDVKAGARGDHLLSPSPSSPLSLPLLVSSEWEDADGSNSSTSSSLPPSSTSTSEWSEEMQPSAPLSPGKSVFLEAATGGGSLVCGAPGEAIKGSSSLRRLASISPRVRPLSRQSFIIPIIFLAGMNLLLGGDSCVSFPNGRPSPSFSSSSESPNAGSSPGAARDDDDDAEGDTDKGQSRMEEEEEEEEEEVSW